MQTRKVKLHFFYCRCFRTTVESIALFCHKSWVNGRILARLFRNTDYMQCVHECVHAHDRSSSKPLSYIDTKCITICMVHAQCTFTFTFTCTQYMQEKQNYKQMLKQYHRRASYFMLIIAGLYTSNIRQ